MKTKLYILAGAAAMLLAAACSEEKMPVGTEGSLTLQATLNSDVKVISRATEQELADGATIFISSEKGLVRKYQGVANIPASIDLATGHYIAEAWAGDSVSASFDTRCYKGRQEFDINAGQTTAVDLVCPIANTVVSVDYAEGLEEVLTDFTMKVSHKRGALTFEGRDTRKGYFMMPSTDKNLAYELRGTQIDGSEFVFSDVIENVSPTTEYVLTVKYTKPTETVGGATFTITIDRQEIEVNSQVKVTVPPRFEGYGFDLSQNVTGEMGSIGRRTVYVTSATEITNLVMTSDELLKYPVFGGNDCDLLLMSEACVTTLRDAGINFSVTRGEGDDRSTLVQINFEKEYTDALANGDYSFVFDATDDGKQTSQATLNIIVSDAPVMTEDVDAATVGSRTAVLRGTVSREGVETVGFNYRKVGTAAWTSVEGVVASRALAQGTVFTATLTGLDFNSTYEYVATAGDFVSAIVKQFTTADEPQLPNAGFEQWSGSKPMLICANASEMFWDSGNHGSKIIKDITTAESNIKHSGNYAAKLQTSVLFGTVAAGNLFTGHFLGTENTTKGILGWGRPFTAEPKAMKLWVKYEPKNITKKGEYSGSDLNVGDPDRGIVYIALLDDSKVTYDGNTWPVIVRTKDLAGYSFHKDGANVIAYGEHIFAEATAGDGLIEVTIPIEYIRQGVKPSNILVVASASIYGDYYCGGDGSTMYLDDVELIY